MTAEVVRFDPEGRDDDTIRRTIKALAKGKGIRAEDIAASAHMSRSAYYDKLKALGRENPFSAGEVADIARRLGVSVEKLYSGLDGTFIPEDDPPPNGGNGLPRLDSNQEPSGYLSPQVSGLLRAA